MPQPNAPSGGMRSFEGTRSNDTEAPIADLPDISFRLAEESALHGGCCLENSRFAKPGRNNLFCMTPCLTPASCVYSTEQTGTPSRSKPAAEHAANRHRITLQTGG
jgi:hypothetical protein